ncbi:FMN-binding protein, partial [Oleiphilus sp. HI0043]|uniref:FMN-binding protein n=1 Tax=Oleiphilus sp. HI0043 TaxID=1822233 RepID=UPI0012E7C18F
MKYPFDGTSFSLRNLYLLVSCLFICLIGSPAFSPGLDITPIKAPLPFIQEAFPNASSISEKTGDPQIKTIFQDEQVIGYAFETDDVARIPAYSGEPVNTLVTLDTQGTIISANVLEHHEPILLVGIPEQDLCDFTDQYQGLKVNTKVKVGTGTEENTEYLDGVSGATVTVMVMNMGIIRAANEVAIAHGIIEASEFASQAAATINQEVYQPSDWQTLTGNGAIRRFHLNNSKVDDAFMATEAADQAAPLEEKEDTFV